MAKVRKYKRDANGRFSGGGKVSKLVKKVSKLHKSNKKRKAKKARRKATWGK